LTDLDRVLNADDRGRTDARYEFPHHPVDGGHVSAANRGHFDQLSLDQLDGVVFMQDAEFAHPEVLLDGEAVRLQGTGSHNLPGDQLHIA
jgi:hypothetical protein